MTNSSEFFKKLKKVDGGYQITLDDGSVIVGNQISDIIRQMMKKSNDEPSFKKMSLPDNLKYFVPRHQIKTMASSDEFEDIANELSEIFEMMPKTYEQDGKGDNAKVYLHYFYGDSHWYITEKDSEKEQLQMFGYAVLNGDLENAELGYISFDELNENNVELDFHFDIDTLGNIKKELNQRYTFARGGKLNKYDYVPNRNIESLELTKGNRTVDVDGADVIDGVYVKKGKYAKGGGVGEKFYEGQSIYIEPIVHSEELKKALPQYNKYANKELVIEKIEYDTPFKRAKAFVRGTGEKVPFDIFLNKENVKQYARGGKLNKYDYVPNRNIESLELTKGNRTVDVDGADVIDGVYVKKGKYASGGYITLDEYREKLENMSDEELIEEIRYEEGIDVDAEELENERKTYISELVFKYRQVIGSRGYRYAKGGMSEHGLKTGDKITGKSGSTGVKLYNKNRKESGIVNLDKGIRKTNSYGKSEPTIVRGFVDDEPYEYKEGGSMEYGKGGSMYSRNASKSKNIAKKPIKKKKKKEPTIVRGFVDDEPYEYKKGGSIHSSLLDDFFN